MKYLLMAICAAVMGLGGASMVIGAAATDTEKTENGKKKMVNETPLKQDHLVRRIIPVYKPPLRGAPAGRVAGGTRGQDQALPYLCLIVPEHVGLTTFSQPVLYFYQSTVSPYPVEFTLIRHQGINPIVETRIPTPEKTGIQVIHLADYGVRLEPGVQYKWFIALVPDAQHRSKDILAAGGIEFTDQTQKIKDLLVGVQPALIPSIYAEAGLWYDAFHSLSVQVETSPDDVGLRQSRAALLEQIGLVQVAGSDLAGD